MRKNMYDEVYSIIQNGVNMGIGHITTDSTGFKLNSFNINTVPKVNFALCDYLALGRDERIKDAAIKEINNHGVFSSISKVYLKLDLYELAENILAEVFESPVLLFTRTTLAHIGVLPIITDTNDAIILDHQVHTTVRIASDMLKSYGNYVETIRHSRMDILEERICELIKKYHHVWYLADGIYSTYGDKLPVEDIKRLVNKYEQFHVYIDDSHGMSWYGKNGKGFINETLGKNQRIVISTSLCKGFGTEGAAIICYDEKLKKRLETCSSPLIFTGPLSPGALGGIISSAKIHLTEEINIRQSKLKSLIDLVNSTAIGLGLPLLSNSDSPILFFAAGKSDFCQEICANLLEEGYFTNAFHYPAVPINNSGVRATVNLYLSENDIRGMLVALRKEYDKALKKRNLTIEDILKHYKKDKQTTSV